MKAFEKKHRDTINDVLNQMDALETRKAEIRESVKALAEELETKPAAINKIIKLVKAERKLSGALESESTLLDYAIEASR